MHNHTHIHISCAYAIEMVSISVWMPLFPTQWKRMGNPLIRQNISSKHQSFSQISPLPNSCPHFMLHISYIVWSKFYIVFRSSFLIQFWWKGMRIVFRSRLICLWSCLVLVFRFGLKYLWAEKLAFMCEQWKLPPNWPSKRNFWKWNKRQKKKKSFINYESLFERKTNSVFVLYAQCSQCHLSRR